MPQALADGHTRRTFHWQSQNSCLLQKGKDGRLPSRSGRGLRLPPMRQSAFESPDCLAQLCGSASPPSCEHARPVEDVNPRTPMTSRRGANSAATKCDDRLGCKLVRRGEGGSRIAPHLEGEAFLRRLGLPHIHCPEGNKELANASNAFKTHAEDQSPSSAPPHKDEASVTIAPFPLAGRRQSSATSLSTAVTTAKTMQTAQRNRGTPRRSNEPARNRPRPSHAHPRDLEDEHQVV